jgi:predicted DNA-binding protein
MVRTQISLTEEQHRFLKILSKESGRSLSELIRQAIEQMRKLESSQRKQAASILGQFKADKDDISSKHDEYLWS